MGDVDDSSDCGPRDEEDRSFPGTSSSNKYLNTNEKWPTGFTSYASFLLNPNAGGGPENNIYDNIRLICLSTIVQFLQQQLVKVTEATSLVLTKLKEAHEVEMTQPFFAHKKEFVNDFQINKEAETPELNCQMEEVSKEHSATQPQTRGVEDTIQLEFHHGKKRAHKMQAELGEMSMTKRPKPNMGQDVKTSGMTVGLESNHHHSQEAGSASDHEIQWLKSTIQEKDKAMEELKSKNSHLMSKCEKVEAQLAQKAAQESLKTGSPADDHANQSTLEDACKRVDKATDNLIRVLHLWSITCTSGSSKSQDQDLERFLCAICPASLTHFSRSVQVKYAWGHWICITMFNYFEHVFFAVDDGSMTSPLESKLHALECFRSFQEKRHMSSLKLYDECWMFRAFCEKKYSAVFPAALLEHALRQRSVNRCGQFDDECIEIYQQFLDVAKAVWLLHEVAFSFDPPVSILRMAPGMPFDKRYHESVIHDVDSNGVPQAVLLLIRPAFRVRDTIIRSRVFCLTSDHVDFYNRKRLSRQ